MEHLNGCLNGFVRISGSQGYDIVMEFANICNFVLSFVVGQQIYLSTLYLPEVIVSSPHQCIIQLKTYETWHISAYAQASKVLKSIHSLPQVFKPFLHEHFT